LTFQVPIQGSVACPCAVAETTISAAVASELMMSDFRTVTSLNAERSTSRILKGALQQTAESIDRLTSSGCGLACLLRLPAASDNLLKSVKGCGVLSGVTHCASAAMAAPIEIPLPTPQDQSLFAAAHSEGALRQPAANGFESLSRSQTLRAERALVWALGASSGIAAARHACRDSARIPASQPLRSFRSLGGSPGIPPQIYFVGPGIAPSCCISLTSSK
jgi:hypothetical protein